MRPTFVQRWIGIGAVALLLPLSALAQQAFTRGPANLRAGPSDDYPLVAPLAVGQPVDVQGCTNGYGWCDVTLPNELRGWVAAQALDYAYDDQRVPIAAYGAAIGIPLVGFAIGSYWADNYRNRSWYGDPRWWHGAAPPPMAGWRPMPPPRPGWHPNPWNPGFRPHPGFRPPGHPGFRPPGPGFRPHPDPGFRPPRPGPGFHPGPGFRPHPGGRPPGGGMRPSRPGGGGGGGHGGGGHHGR